jgi:uncharacterized protein YyaL (SSP411 family)
MLYGQALLALAYLEAYQAIREPEFAAAARHIFEYVLRDLLSPEEAFCAAEDADSEGEEGVFYAWTPAEMTAVLGEKRGSVMAGYFGVTERGNFEHGKSILHRPHEKEQYTSEKGLDPSDLNEILEESREKLLEARSNRERPFKDDNILTAWNGLIIAALARGAAVLEAPLYAQAAAAATGFVLEKLTRTDGRLLRRYRDGEAAYPACLDDYAFLVWGLLELYQATFQAEQLARAISLTEMMLEIFQGEGGALLYAGADQSGDRPVFAHAYDGATPSGNSVAALNLLKLGRMTARPGKWLSPAAPVPLRSIGWPPLSGASSTRTWCCFSTLRALNVKRLKRWRRSWSR